ncbi:MAG: class I SAM-dependent methyltransferase [Phycisphaerales bacterium]|nr:class I SAM-dependent methyltransferase [Phycisphaerales bacterium]MCB9857066.1 class I SAM-dependent methyltransferase [Phycisphaerales bacterium]MCB9861807.1 class I SAM-dependent methyltransferase [Phycisphaerales bacterium]
MANAPIAGNDDAITNAFHTRYYDNPYQTWSNTFWMGCQILKCPLDLWVYQEIMFETKPDLIIETGTYKGGSAVFLASMFDAMARVAPEDRCPRRVLSIDIEEQDRPTHLRVRYHTGSSVADETLTLVKQIIAEYGAERIMVILDSDHTRDHVLKELDAYAPLVTPGCYMIVEDTNVNGHPAYEAFGPGPMEAVEAFLSKSDQFEQDRTREKYYMTFNPGGFLKRK